MQLKGETCDELGHSSPDWLGFIIFRSRHGLGRCLQMSSSLFASLDGSLAAGPKELMKTISLLET